MHSLRAKITRYVMGVYCLVSHKLYILLVGKCVRYFVLKLLEIRNFWYLNRSTNLYIVNILDNLHARYFFKIYLPKLLPWIENLHSLHLRFHEMISCLNTISLFSPTWNMINKIKRLHLSSLFVQWHIKRQ